MNPYLISMHVCVVQHHFSAPSIVKHLFFQHTDCHKPEEISKNFICPCWNNWSPHPQFVWPYLLSPDTERTHNYTVSTNYFSVTLLSQKWNRGLPSGKNMLHTNQQRCSLYRICISWCEFIVLFSCTDRGLWNINCLHWREFQPEDSNLTITPKLF